MEETVLIRPIKFGRVWDNIEELRERCVQLSIKAGAAVAIAKSAIDCMQELPVGHTREDYLEMMDKLIPMVKEMTKLDMLFDSWEKCHTTCGDAAGLPADIRYLYDDDNATWAFEDEIKSEKDSQ